MTIRRKNRALNWAIIFSIIVFFCLQLITVARVIAEPRPCVDTLAAATYGEELRHIPKHVAVSGFASTFGDFFPVAKKELLRGREFIRVQLVWRDNHVFGKKELKEAIKEARRYNELCIAHPNKIELSPFTEHNLNNPDSYLNEVQKAAPNCRIVNNPWRGAHSKRYKTEIHNSHTKAPSKPYNFSYDGENSVDSDVKTILAKYSESDLLCVWHPRLNLRWRMKDGTSRAQRIKEAKIRKPNKQMLLSLVYLFTNIGKVDVPKKTLVKSHADRHDALDAKGDKLLIITQIKEIDSKGKVKPIKVFKQGATKPFGELRYYGPFNDENTGKVLGWRYYATRFGYEYGANLQGRIGNKHVAFFNGGFRAGSL